MKKLTTYVLIVFSSLSIFACGNRTNNDSKKSKSVKPEWNKLNQLTNMPLADKLHLYFHIKELGQTDSSVMYVVKSLYEGDTVGLKIEVLKNIEPGVSSDGVPDGDAGFTRGPIKISSIGTQSDNLVKSLGIMFNLPTTGKMTKDVLQPIVFSSNQEKVDLSKAKTYSFKYFFDNATDKPGELFGVLDTYKRSFELSEKDSTFRAAIISAFEGK